MSSPSTIAEETRRDPVTGPLSAADTLSDPPALEIRNILLCTDFSPASQAAADAAVRLWKQTRAHITVLHVCEYGPIPATTEAGLAYVEALYAEQHRQLHAVVKHLRSLGVPATAQSLDGNAPGVILEQLGRGSFDLCVLGTRATHGIERLVFGSTAEGVFRRATCPVLTVGSHCAHARSEDLSAPVVVATDFQETGLPSVRYAAALANQIGAALHCVHVLPLGERNEHEPIVEDIVKKALARLTHHGAMCRVAPVHQVLYDSDVSHAVVEYARAANAQAVVLGVRRKTRIAAHLPPQRTYRIIMTAPCPVLTLSFEPDRAHG